MDRYVYLIFQEVFMLQERKERPYYLSSLVSLSVCFYLLSVFFLLCTISMFLSHLSSVCPFVTICSLPSFFFVPSAYLLSVCPFASFIWKSVTYTVMGTRTTECYLKLNEGISSENKGLRFTVFIWSFTFLNE